MPSATVTSTTNGLNTMGINRSNSVLTIQDVQPQSTNKFRDINDVEGFSQKELDCLDKLLSAVSKSDILVGVALLHKHFDLTGNEVLVEKKLGEGKSSMASPMQYNEGLTPSVVAFTSDGVPVGVQYRDHSFGRLSIDEQRLSRLMVEAGAVIKSSGCESVFGISLLNHDDMTSKFVEYQVGDRDLLTVPTSDEALANESTVQTGWTISAGKRVCTSFCSKQTLQKRGIHVKVHAYHYE